MVKVFLVLQLVFCQLLSAYTCEEISEKLYAVHGTDVLPIAGQIKAGSRDKPFSDPLAIHLYPDTRNTVHFALGALVYPIKTKEDSVYSWDQVRYAIVTQLKTILPQVINLNTYDTFTLGSVQADPDRFILIAPENEVLVQSFYTIRRYDPSVKKIRQVVEEVIKEKGGFVVTMVANHSEEEISPAYKDDFNVNTKEFFTPLKTAFPHISLLGLRWIECGCESSLCGQLESKMSHVAKTLLSGTFELSNGKKPAQITEDLEQELTNIKTLVYRFDHYVAGAPFSSPVKIEYDDKRFAVQTWINILTAEIELNKKYHKTLYGAFRTIWSEIDILRSHPEELQKYLLAHLESLPSSAAPSLK